MKQKTLTILLMGTLLSVLNSGAAYAGNQYFDKLESSSYVLQPGVYMGVGYAYARIQNAGVRNFDVSAPATVNHKSRYGSGDGVTIKFGQLLLKNWGYELNVSDLSSTQNTNFAGYAGTANLSTKISTSIAEAMGVYATSTLTPNLDLYVKLGLGYEQQKITYNANGSINNALFNSTETTKNNSVGLASALELRYHIMQHLALSVEINNLAAKQNVVAGNIGVVGNF